MAGIKEKIMSLNLSNTYPSVKITDGSHSLVLGNGVVHATSSLTLADVLYAICSKIFCQPLIYQSIYKI